MRGIEKERWKMYNHDERYFEIGKKKTNKKVRAKEKIDKND